VPQRNCCTPSLRTNSLDHRAGTTMKCTQLTVLLVCSSPNMALIKFTSHPSLGQPTTTCPFPLSKVICTLATVEARVCSLPSLFFLLASLTLLDRHPTSPSHFISEPSLYRHSYQTRNRAPKSTRYAFSLCNFSPFLSPEPLGFFASSSSITRHLQM